MMKIKLFVAIFFAFGCYRCQNYQYDGVGQDVPTAGKIEIYVDRADSLLILEWIEMFHANYPKAQISPIFASHNQLMKWVETDSLKKAFILNHFLNKDQKEFIANNRNCTVHETHLAQTAVAIISHKKNVETKFSLDRLINVSASNGKIRAFDGLIIADSWGAPLLTLQKTLFSKNKLKFMKSPSSFLHLSDDQKIIDFVSENPNAIGIISLSLVGNNYSKVCLNNQKKIKILKVSNSNNEIAHFPFQSQIKAKQYPLIQNIVAYDLQGYSGLANGFITFVNSQPGQIMTKKNGLIPTNDVGRTIELGTN